MSQTTVKRSARSGTALAVAARGAVKKTGTTKSVKPLPFYSQVQVLKKRRSVPADLIGRKGVILGRAKASDGGWHYAVFFHGRSYYLRHSVLKPTGVIFQRSDFYRGDSVRVSVNASGGGAVLGD